MFIGEKTFTVVTAKTPQSLSIKQEEKRRDKTPAHTINVQSLMPSVGEPQVVDNLTLHQFDSLVDHIAKVSEEY